MPSLSEALRALELNAQRCLGNARNGENAAVEPITAPDVCAPFVDGVLSIIGSGLYPGLTPWNLFKLLQRLDGASSASASSPALSSSPSSSSQHPLVRKLRFASKTLALITGSLSSASDVVKSRAFVRCALNTGHLTAIIELLSCVGTIDRLALVEGDSGFPIHDLWAFLLSNGTDNSPLTQRSGGGPAASASASAINKLLQPFIADGMSVLRVGRGEGLEGAYNRFVRIVGLVGGPPLSSFLESKPCETGSEGLFRLPLQCQEDNDENNSSRHAGTADSRPFESVYPSEDCVDLKEPSHAEDAPTATSVSIAVEDTSASPASPSASVTKKKTIIKKVVVKKKVAKGADGTLWVVGEVMSPTSPRLASPVEQEASPSDIAIAEKPSSPENSAKELTSREEGDSAQEMEKVDVVAVKAKEAELPLVAEVAEEEDNSVPFEPVIVQGKAFLDMSDAIASLMQTSAELLKQSEAFTPFQPNSAALPPTESSLPSPLPSVRRGGCGGSAGAADEEWTSQLASTIINVPSAIKLSLEASIGDTATKLNAMLASS